MGRWMKLDDKPRVICDSAHNPPAFELAMKQLKAERYNNLHIVLGFMADKDVTTMLKLVPGNAKVYFTQAQTSRSMTAEALSRAAAKCGMKGGAYHHVTDALAAARKAAGDKDLIYVGGSMYVLADLLKALGYDR